MNLVLGGGDVGKTTILDAISLLLSPTNSATVFDSDAILQSELREVVREYERTGPQSMPTPKHQPISAACFQLAAGRISAISPASASKVSGKASKTQAWRASMLGRAHHNNKATPPKIRASNRLSAPSEYSTQRFFSVHRCCAQASLAKSA